MEKEDFFFKGRTDSDFMSNGKTYKKQIETVKKQREKKTPRMQLAQSVSKA